MTHKTRMTRNETIFQGEGSTFIWQKRIPRKQRTNIATITNHSVNYGIFNIFTIQQ